MLTNQHHDILRAVNYLTKNNETPTIEKLQQTLHHRSRNELVNDVNFLINTRYLRLNGASTLSLDVAGESYVSNSDTSALGLAKMTELSNSENPSPNDPRRNANSKLNFFGIEVPISQKYAWLMIVAGAVGVIWWNWEMVCSRLGYCYPRCRIEANGVERWMVSSPILRDSGWIGGGSSPGKYCGDLLKAIQATNTSKKIELVGTHEDHKSEYHPFKEDYYRYTCDFRVSEPVFKLAANEHCPEK
jgi:hypothetical protein